MMTRHSEDGKLPSGWLPPCSAAGAEKLLPLRKVPLQVSRSIRSDFTTPCGCCCQSWIVHQGV